MKHKLTREIREWRNRKKKIARDGARTATALMADEATEDAVELDEDALDAWTEEDETSS